MDLNGISCGGYSVGKNEVTFSLYDTDYDTVSALNKKTLTYTISENDKIVFEGYHIVSVNVGEHAIRVRFAKDLDDATAASINALETNFSSLHDTVVANQASTSAGMADISNIIAPIIMRENLTDAEASNFKQFYPEYKVGVDYKQNWIFRYGEDLYRIGQDHTSQEQWVPGADGTTALYSKIEITESGYEVWQEWDGVSGSYANGQIVQDPTDEKLYKSLIDNNVWGPPSEQPSYWELYEA